MDAGVKPKPTLEELAREQFPDLSEAELRLLRAVAKGLLAYCGDPAKGRDEPVNNPRNADAWGKEHDIRGDLIRWLCVEPGVQSRIDFRGIIVFSARITGELDLSYVVVGFPLIFYSCKFAGPLRLVQADLPRLNLTMSVAGAVFANGAHIRGDVLLSGGFSAEGEVNLYGASVGGSLGCDNGSFKNANGVALNMENAKIEGAVLLRESFSAEGAVLLYAVSIGSNLECDKGSFKNANGALNAERAKIEGSVYLRNEFSAEGAVNLYAASVGGSLECEKGSFKNANGIALNVTLSTIERTVLLRDGFTALGKVMLVNTAVTGDFDITDANFAEAQLDIQRASAGTLRGEPASWPKSGSLFLDGFFYGRLADSPTDANHRLRCLRLQLSPTTKSSFSPQPYRHIAQVLRQQGHEAAAQQILIGLEDDRRKYGGLTQAQRLWAFILKWTIAYGYQPFRALRFIGIFVILGFLVFGAAYQSGRLVPSDKEAYENFKAGQLPGYYEGFCALVYSFDNFVPIIDLGQRSRWKPIDTEDEILKPPKRNANNGLVCAVCDPPLLLMARHLFSWCPPLAARIIRFFWTAGFIRFFWWLDIVAGWFFTGLFAAGISGLVRRN